MGKLYNNIIETIGNTPAVRIHRLAPPHVQLYVKVEAMNPMGSIKDRLAWGVIEDAERRGVLKPGQTVIEATSGNTGIGLAMVCAQKGYPLVVVMAENFSVERRKLMRFLGAKVVLTPASDKGTGMLAKAIELAEANDWFLCRQFENEANADIHSKTTAQEILRDFGETHLDYWVTGFGTGGTLKGVGRVLREKSPKTQIVVSEPDNSQLLGSGIAQERLPDGSHSKSHPHASPHLVQGWSPDFIPKLAEDSQKSHLIDAYMPVNCQDALYYAQELATKEGIFCGISGGATFAGAIKVCENAEAGSTVLCMLPDTGERYMTTPLFAHIGEEMSEEELAISNSTPNYRFGGPKVCAVPEKRELPKVTEKAKQFVEGRIQSDETPVVMFALEWCEFCWAARKLLEHLDVDYKAVDVDSVQYQEDNFGRQIRDALEVVTSEATIPQIFVGGERIGGCMELLEAYKLGDLQSCLERAGVQYRKDISLDPYSLLPSWVGQGG